MKRISKRFIGMVVVVAIIMTFMTPYDYKSHASDEKIFVVNLGNPSKSESTVTFPDAVVSTEGSDKITSMTISVDKGSINTAGDIMDSLSKHQTVSWLWPSGEAVGSVQAKLRSISFSYEQGMKVTVVVDGNKMVLPDSSSTTITSFIPNTPQGSTNVDGSVHYYMYVESEDIHWDTAYNNARSFYYMGMRGYLVTITQLEEDKVLDKITSYGAWAGGLRLSESFNAENYDSANASVYSRPATTAGSHWVWCNGPEKGVEINNSGSTDSTGKDSKQSVKVVSTGYSNWRRVKNDSTNQEPNNYNDSEWCMQVHYPGDTSAQQADKGAVQGWNDLAVESNSHVKIMGYFVEFSNYPGGHDSGYNENYITSITKDMDNSHSYDISFIEDEEDNNDKIVISCTVSGHNDRYEFSVKAEDKTYTSAPYNIGTALIDGITEVYPGYRVKIEYEGTGATEYTKSTTPPTNAGTYKVIATLVDGSGNTVKDSTNNNDVIVTNAFNITKAELTITANPQNKHVGEAVSSTTSDVSVTGLLGKDVLDSVVITGDTTAVTTAGMLTVSDAKVTNASNDVTNNYSIQYNDGKLEVSKFVPTISVNPVASDITYGDELKDSLLENGKVTCGSEEISGTFTWKTPTTSPEVSNSETTEYEVIFTPEDETKYDVITTTVKVKVLKKPIHLNWADTTMTYNGEEQKPTATVVASDIPEGKTAPTITVEGAKTDACEGTSSYIATASLSDPNYVIATDVEGKGSSTEFIITKKDVNIELKDQTLSYGDTLSSTIADAVKDVTGLVTGDTLSGISLTIGGSIPNQTIYLESAMIENGTKNVTNNYNITYTEANLTVKRKDIDPGQVTVPTASDLIYGDQLVSSILSGGEVTDGSHVIDGTFTWKEKDTVPEAGTSSYEVIFTPAGADAERYHPITISVPVDVAKKIIDITWSNDVLTYNGLSQKPTAIPSGSIGSDDVGLTVSGAKIDANTDSEPTYTATATITNPNYEIKSGSETHEFTISRKNLTDPSIVISVLTDKDDNVIVTITDKSVPEELKEHDDFKVTITPDGQFEKVKIDGKNNYEGTYNTIVRKQKWTGSLLSMLVVDESIQKINPKLASIKEENALDLLMRLIEDSNLPQSIKSWATRIISEIANSATRTSENGSYKAVVTLEMKDADKTVIDREKDCVQAVIDGNLIPKGAKIGKYLDLSLWLEYEIIAQPGDVNLIKTKEKVTDTSDKYLGEGKGFKAKVTLTIPDELRPAVGSTRDYYVVRVHNDGMGNLLTDVLDLIREGYNITFETDKYSTYAIVYTESKVSTTPSDPTQEPVVKEPVEKEPVEQEPAENPSTGDTTPIAMLTVTMLLCVVGVIILTIKRKAEK